MCAALTELDQSILSSPRFVNEVRVAMCPTHHPLVAYSDLPHLRAISPPRNRNRDQLAHGQRRLARSVQVCVVRTYSLVPTIGSCVEKALNNRRSSCARIGATDPPSLLVGHRWRSAMRPRRFWHARTRCGGAVLCRCRNDLCQQPWPRCSKGGQGVSGGADAQGPPLFAASHIWLTLDSGKFASFSAGRCWRSSDFALAGRGYLGSRHITLGRQQGLVCHGASRDHQSEVLFPWAPVLALSPGARMAANAMSTG